MKLTPLPIVGAYAFEADPFIDPRGRFLRLFSRTEFERRGISFRLVQNSVSETPRRHTLRGFHFQKGRYAEKKIVNCLRGETYNVLADLRPASASFGRWTAVRLGPRAAAGVYVPPGVANGYLTLTSDVIVVYQMSQPYRPSAAAGLRYDDPFFSVDWPARPRLVSARDLSFPPFHAHRRARR